MFYNEKNSQKQFFSDHLPNLSEDPKTSFIIYSPGVDAIKLFSPVIHVPRAIFHVATKNGCYKKQTRFYEPRDVFYEKKLTCQWTMVKHLVTNFYNNVSTKTNKKFVDKQKQIWPAVKYLASNMFCLMKNKNNKGNFKFYFVQ